jgi:hypothetical protein
VWAKRRLILLHVFDLSEDADHVTGACEWNSADLHLKALAVGVQQDDPIIRSLRRSQQIAGAGTRTRSSALSTSPVISFSPATEQSLRRNQLGRQTTVSAPPTALGGTPARTAARRVSTPSRSISYRRTCESPLVGNRPERVSIGSGRALWDATAAQ